MEWLSAEEKSRSMMPYLLDLPPLDVTDEVNKKETSNISNDEAPKKAKSDSNSKNAMKESETDK